MNHLLDNDVDQNGRSYAGRRRPVLEDTDPGDREISLGTPTILGIFFVLAIICAAFFGFGYSMGRRSIPATAATVIDDTTVPGAGIAKPTAGSPAAPVSVPAEAPAETTPEQSTPQTVAVPTDSQPTAKSPAPAPEAKPAATPKSAAQVPPVPAPQATPAPAGTFIVQVAAVTSQDVADILTSSLQKKGYTVAVRHEPQDKLLHIQIGPFSDRKQAEAMRQRVIADGFNAIVK